jgi:hypothetical protein
MQILIMRILIIGSLEPSLQHINDSIFIYIIADFMINDRGYVELSERFVIYKQTL